MGEVITLPVVRVERCNDGGKMRILRRRANFKARKTDDLVMDHADFGMPSDSAPFVAPDSDPA